tara:strand:- start:732 stop:1352 length:621 start_codon:yes stop_codon:yes gene_type:complete
MIFKTLNPVKIILQGEEKIELLQSIISSDIIRNNSHCHSYILTPQGKILFELQVFINKNNIELICTNDQSDLFSFLNNFVKLSEVSIKKIFTKKSEYGFEYFIKNLEKGRIDSNFIRHSTLFPSEVHEEYIDYKKGCFIGQEVVSRIKHRSLKKNSIFIFRKNEDFELSRINDLKIILDIDRYLILRVPTKINLKILTKKYKLTKV